MIKSVKQIQSDDPIISRVQDAIVPALNRLLSVPIVNGTILSNISLKVGSNAVAHGLGQTLQGWSIVRQRALANVYDTQDSNKSPSQNLLLVSDQVVSIDLLVF